MLCVFQRKKANEMTGMVFRSLSEVGAGAFFALASAKLKKEREKSESAERER
jgi:hypothetical protein